MGIRFCCPNGHKLNVKSFLAGKRGICPHCQSKFEIPSESDPNLLATDSARMANTAGQSSDSGADLSDSTPRESDDGGLAFNVAAAEELSSSNAHNPAANPPQTDTTRSTHDPIAEAPHAVWYVRPPSGGQFGPASGDIMRTWIGEGRVPKDALIWREGWPEWQVASALFPGLSHAIHQTVPQSEVLGQLPQIATGSTGQVLADRIQPRKTNKSNNLIVTALIVACVGLFFVLLVVLRR